MGDDGLAGYTRLLGGRSICRLVEQKACLHPDAFAVLRMEDGMMMMVMFGYLVSVRGKDSRCAKRKLGEKNSKARSVIGDISS